MLPSEVNKKKHTPTQRRSPALYPVFPWPCFRDVFTIWMKAGPRQGRNFPLLFAMLNPLTQWALFRIPNFDKICRNDSQLRCYRSLIKLYCESILIHKIFAVKWFLNIIVENSLPVRVYNRVAVSLLAQVSHDEVSWETSASREGGRVWVI